MGKEKWNKLMWKPKQGTISVLLGCHSPIHSLLVWIAWWKLYGKPPRPWETVCIFLHDIGHWGKDYLDYFPAKEGHAIKGARAARKLFGSKGYKLVIGHNKYLGAEPSKMYRPDKYSYAIAPIWWLWTNTIFEPKLIRLGCSRWQSAKMFKTAMVENIKAEFPKEGHDIYLEQWKDH